MRRLLLLLVLLSFMTGATAARRQTARKPAPKPAAKPAPKPTPKPTPPAEKPMNLRLLLPAEIPAVPGREVNLYYDNVILHPRSDLFIYDVDCPKGMQQQERYTWTPKPEEVGLFPLTLKISDLNGKMLAEGTTNIHVYPLDAGAGKAVSALIIGDSLTGASVYPDEIYNLMQQPGNPQFTMIGNVIPNKDKPGAKHEGYGGWRAATFVSQWGSEPVVNGRRARSPFLYEKEGKPVLDFQQYLAEQNAGQAPDFITILLGCNDNFGAKDDTIEASIDDFLKNMDILIAEFHKVRPDTKIGVVSLMPGAATQDAFGANYGCGQTRWQYKKNQHRVMERVVAKYGNREAENIYLVPAYVSLDAVNNYPKAKGPANARGDATDFTRLCNGVHPAASGYKQLADGIYCWMKGQLAK
ncbi:MAG: SGNH/GDSL hydrolase family protein [Armatimonadia bacterium]